ncbi:MAG: hypothetical protein ACTSXD_09965 [Candidatus Heimdallarchaeaceae archaeon]
MKDDKRVFWKIVLTEGDTFDWYECILQRSKEIPEELPYKLKQRNMSYRKLVETLPNSGLEEVRQFLNYVRELTPENNTVRGCIEGTWYDNTTI